MSAQAAVLILFGIGCSDPCPVAPVDVAAMERRAVQLLGSRGFEVRPAPPDAPRPTGSSSPLEGADVAKLVTADRVVALDLERDGTHLWITQFVRGVPGPWAVEKVACRIEKERFVCPTFERLLGAGLRPRTALDVDVVSALRAKARGVGKCIAEEDRVIASERIFGRVEMDLVAAPNGTVQVKAIAPARVSRSRFGGCLRGVMEAIDLGPFEGEPIKFSVPIDL